MEKNFESYAVFYWQPVDFYLEDGYNVVKGFGLNDDFGCCVLNTLKLFCLVEGYSSQQRVVSIKLVCDISVYYCFCLILGEVVANFANVIEI